jgi:hypothetical protein
MQNSMHTLIFKIQINGSYPDLFYCSGMNYIDCIPAPRIIYIFIFSIVLIYYFSFCKILAINLKCYISQDLTSVMY